MLIMENMCQIYVYKCKCYCSICLCSLSKHVRLDRKYHGRTHDFLRIPTSVVLIYIHNCNLITMRVHSAAAMVKLKERETHREREREKEREKEREREREKDREREGRERGGERARGGERQGEKESV